VAAAGADYNHVRQGGRVVDLIIDLGSGVTAKAACEALVEMGVRLRWHMDQDPQLCEGSWERELPGLE
jgi:hypothetical protein